MWFGKIKIRQADSLWTKYKKIKGNHTCVVCGKKHEPNSKGLGVSHFHGRRKESVRFDDENTDLMCNIPCHAEWESEKKEGRKYYEFMINKLGIDKFNWLQMRANKIGKKDDEMTILWIKDLMQGLKEGE